jgi:hypothetical protein
MAQSVLLLSSTPKQLMKQLRPNSLPYKVNEYIISRGWNIPLWTHEEWYTESGVCSPLARHRCHRSGLKTSDWKEANPGKDLLILCAGMKVAQLTSWQLDHILPKCESFDHHHSNIRLLPGWLNNKMGNKGWTHEQVEEKALTDPERPLFQDPPEWWRSTPLEEFLSLIPVSGLLRL